MRRLHPKHTKCLEKNYNLFEARGLNVKIDLHCNTWLLENLSVSENRRAVQKEGQPPSRNKENVIQ
jgi:hypothetical protein